MFASFPKPSSVIDETQEVNFKGTFLVTQEFLKLIGPSRPATIINITSAAGISVMPTTAAYALSKLTQIQIQRFVAAENPNVVAVSLHPGTVLTSITKPAFVKFSKDTMELAGGVSVWLASGDKIWMNGRYMGVNWDVEDLEGMKEKIVGEGELFMELKGTFGPARN
jgi:NAD(P)-dependent dehydrogenase (short-subunit alcohol dehydrogenase family)